VTLIAVLVGLHLPTGFIPQEDLGYLDAALQLPDASSLQRTDAAAQQMPSALLKIPGVAGVIAVDGFNLLTQAQSSSTAFFFISLGSTPKPG
jgi:HAE1 family hydrophobic/amphiphilic exporter-1